MVHHAHKHVGINPTTVMMIIVSMAVTAQKDNIFMMANVLSDMNVHVNSVEKNTIQDLEFDAIVTNVSVSMVVGCAQRTNAMASVLPSLLITPLSTASTSISMVNVLMYSLEAKPVTCHSKS